MMEYNEKKWVKLITLEGTVALKIDGKKSRGGVIGKSKKIKVPAGQMIIMRPDGEIITKPVDVDLKRLLATSILAGDKTFGPLSAEARRHIADAVADQEKLKSKGLLVGGNQIERHPGSRLTEHRNTVRDVHEHSDNYDTGGPPSGPTNPNP